MSHKRGVTRRARADELSMQAVEDTEPTTGLTVGNLTNSPSPSVDPQQRPEVLAPEHPGESYAQAYGAQTVPSREQSPLRVAGPSQTATQGTATQGSYSPWGMGLDSGSGQNLGDAPSEPDHVYPDAGDNEEEGYFTIPASEVSTLWQEYTEFINLKDNTEIVLSEAMEATEQLNTVFSQIRTSMNRMSLRMKELFLVPSKKASGKMREPEITGLMMKQLPRQLLSES
ncbi:hypothetical protein M422DRAFT_249907 [Sphaerobolus stellatus SS14]|uniref:Uncharacterized protein n=1 Tax=Sphaerobolus stellatus (strain SS14) TaxID=990650 RepID=A0A0C9VUS7_SPHS4|nr:hypothetical protein M422DRAFT_249907 [Sphaerobolus stellatus SS14]